ncbi:MAG TPA: sigma-70 family RNA polymerase sigma factor [Saprospiraceae bacterium]|nr:sigma-70 family RNA polymerase sigma factor [Saprospiraceae bacterium]
MAEKNKKSDQRKSKLHQQFEEEFLPHLEALNTFAYHLTYDEEDAADLVQETYMKAYKFMDKFEEGTNSKAWLFKILKNAYINQYRKRSKRPIQVDYEESIIMQDTEESSSVAGYVDLREDMFDNMLGDEVTTALGSMPEEFRTIILLCDIEGFSYEEIAKIIEVPVGTVRSRIFRARNMLKEKLKHYAESLGFKDYRGGEKQNEEENEI